MNQNPLAFLPPAFVAHAATLRWAPDGEPERALSTLAAPEGWQSLLAAWQAKHPDATPRALASVWFKRYLVLIVPAAAGALARRRWQLPLTLNTTWVRTDADGAVTGVRIDGTGAPADGSLAPEQLWAPLLFDHLEPLVQSLATASGVTPKVLWGNVGNLVESLLKALAAQPAAPTWLETDRALLMDTRRWADERTNPLADSVRYGPPVIPVLAPRTCRLRRICCLRYEIPKQVVCITCPLLKGMKAPEREALTERWQRSA